VKASGNKPLHDPEEEEKRAKEFSPVLYASNGETRTFRFPAIVVDAGGIIIWWYLPGIVGRVRQVSTFRIHEIPVVEWDTSRP
jgi:hypothetical protein